ncbi:MAG: hypothetical protein HYT76_10325 [Deltaproteobacteria bacterium]|nr:hypothetical protein [Deltaproteobacteria bacterium]
MKRRSFLITYAAATILLLSQGCDIDRAWVFRPLQEDLLITTDSLTLTGLVGRWSDGALVDIYEDWGGLPCQSNFYRENYGDYIASGRISYPYETTTDDYGFFEFNLGFTGASQGLYQFECFRPLLRPSRYRLTTYRTDLTAARRQYIFFNWEGTYTTYWGDWVDSSLKNTLSSTTSIIGTFDPAIEYWVRLAITADMAKIETERNFLARYAWAYDPFWPLRVEIWEAPSSIETIIDEYETATYTDIDVTYNYYEFPDNVQVVQMVPCILWEPTVEECATIFGIPEAEVTDDICSPINNDICLAYGRYLGDCAFDWLNSDLSGGACNIYVPSMAAAIDAAFDGGFLTLADGSDNRVQDMARILGNSAAHEIAHAAGLVSNEHLYGTCLEGIEVLDGYGNPICLSHDPFEPDFVAAQRNIPRTIMNSTETPWAPGYFFERCSGSPGYTGYPPETAARCPNRFNDFNAQYLRYIQGRDEP